MGQLRLRLLGPLRVWNGTAWTPVRAAQQRVVLAVLAIEAGRVVATDRLIDEIWGDRPPRAAASVVRGYVLRLRQQLGGGRAGPLVTGTAGYLLAAGPDEVDAYAFDGLVAAGRRALAAGDQEAAVQRLAEALALWHGPPLADVPAAPAVAAQARRWEEDRLTAIEDWLGAQLDLGRHHDILSDLYRLVDEHPLRERCWAYLMQALYRSGRRADALESFQRARRVLVAELGLEPGAPLRSLQQAILADDGPGPEVSGPGGSPAAAAVPAQLPPDLTSFAGRELPLKRLDEALLDGGVVCVVGTAGVGKTALAVHWAHLAAGRFPDGQLYVNLRGFDPAGAAMSPADAVRYLLDALQVPPERIPADLAARVGLYRSRLAGRRILVVLDNARDAGQVRPLLPGVPGCVTLVTSRDDLSGLVIAEAARLLPLDLMSSGEARQLLSNRLGGERVAAERAAVDEIIRRCERLPLALSIVAARAVARPAFALRVLAGELCGLDGFASGDPATDARTVFSWSYRALSPSAARLFRLLAVPGGPDIGAAAASGLAGTPAGPLLVELTRANLVVEHAPGRYLLHDLIREYARELVRDLDTPQERRAALHRLLDHYLHTATAAFGRTEPHQEPLPLDPPLPGTFPEWFADNVAARAWFAAERDNVLAAARQAAATGHDRHAWQLAWALDDFLGREGHWPEQLAVQRAALAAGLRLDDRTAQAHANRGLGNAYGRMGRYEEAHRHYERAAQLFAAVGDPLGEARMHSRLGWLLEHLDRHRDARTHKQRALALYRAAGRPAGEARILNQLGWGYVATGEYRQAVRYCRRAIALARACGDPAGEAMALDSLGYAYHHLDRYDDAAAGFTRALALHRQVGDRYQQAETLVHLGETLAATGRTEEARGAWRQALTLLDDLAHPDAAAVAARLTPAVAGD
jgi:DNA-binding SARP family transcriptional activator